MPTLKQTAIAARLDSELKRLESLGADELEILTEMAELMPLFYELLHMGDSAMDELCERFHGFYRYAKILERLAEGIRSGEVEVPKGDIPGNKNDNIRTLLPRMIINRAFVENFLDEAAPCFAMGVLEQRKKQCAFLALRLEEFISDDVSSLGFNFGHSVFGNKDFEVLHFAFSFYGYKTYNALINPSNMIIKTALKLMVEAKEYFFFAINPDNSVVAFNTDIKEDFGITGIWRHDDRIWRSTTTQKQYEKAVVEFTEDPDPPGTMLEWVCFDNPDYLDLTGEVIEMTPS